MNKLSSLYAAFGADSQITPESRASVIEVTFATRLAFELPLPSAKVDNLIKHYGDMCSILVRNQVAKFNEGFPINIHQTSALVFSVWRYRYYLVHGRNTGYMRTIISAAMAGARDELDYELPPRYKNEIATEVPTEVDMLVGDFVTSSMGQ